MVGFKKKEGQVQWIKPVIPGVRDQPDQHGETPSLLKKEKKKLAGHGGVSL